MSKQIELKNVSIFHDNKSIINDLSWEINTGSYNVLLGGNGAGKTTLTKTILGLHNSFSGEILIEGKKSSKELISKYFGYVPQYSNIKRDFPITVEEVIELECKTSNNVCSLKPKNHLEELGIAQLLNNIISDLSGGEIQKLLISRGLVTNPKILILDEPTNNLDKKSKNFLLRYIEKLNKNEGITIIHITHNASEIVDHGNINYCTLQDGKLIKQ